MLQKAKSLNQIGSVMNSRLEELKIKIDKKGDKPKGIDAYITEDNSDSGDDSFEEFTDDFQASLQDKELDVSKLIDLELIKLLKYCAQLKECCEQESYQDDIMEKAIELGKKTHDKLLIFDMDETLIAAKFEGKVPAKFEKTFSYQLHGIEISVRMRPYVMDCLEKLATMYEIIVFTAGQQDYADHILDYIDPNKKIFKRRLYRQDCIQLQHFFIKDLDIILDRDKEKMIIVDNSIVSFAFDLDNGVPINSYLGTEDDDKELLFLYSFLEEIATVPDVKVPIKASFKLSELQQSVLKKKTTD